METEVCQSGHDPQIQNPWNINSNPFLAPRPGEPQGHSKSTLVLTKATARLREAWFPDRSSEETNRYGHRGQDTRIQSKMGRNKNQNSLVTLLSLDDLGKLPSRPVSPQIHPGEWNIRLSASRARPGALVTRAAEAHVRASGP